MMKNPVKNFVAIIGIFALAIGISTAAPSSDCGDDDVQPINVHSTAKVINKET